MTRYGGAGITDFAEAIEEEAPIGERDWSMDMAYHLAMAFIAMTRLKEQGISLLLPHGEKFFSLSFQRLWRALVYIRRRRVTDNISLNDIARRVTLSRKTGKIYINKDFHLSEEKKPGRPRYKRRRFRLPRYSKRKKVIENNDK